MLSENIMKYKNILEVKEIINQVIGDKVKIKFFLSKK